MLRKKALCLSLQQFKVANELSFVSSSQQRKVLAPFTLLRLNHFVFSHESVNLDQKWDFRNVETVLVDNVHQDLWRCNHHLFQPHVKWITCIPPSKQGNMLDSHFCSGLWPDVKPFRLYLPFSKYVQLLEQMEMIFP
jgi:hypothetical protein